MGDDDLLLDNKELVALYFSEQDKNNYQLSQDVMDMITLNYESVVDARKLIDDTPKTIGTTLTKENLTKLYVATFDRSPDSDGLDYWLNQSALTLEQTAMSFFDQEETQTKYPPSNTNTQFINTVYQNLFDREPDDDGFVYWLKALDAKTIVTTHPIQPQKP